MARGNPQGDWLPPSLISQVLSTPFLQHLFYLSQNYPTNRRFKTEGIINTASGEAGFQHKWAGLPQRPSEKLASHWAKQDAKHRHDQHGPRPSRLFRLTARSSQHSQAACHLPAPWP